MVARSRELHARALSNLVIPQSFLNTAAAIHTLFFLMHRQLISMCLSLVMFVGASIDVLKQVLSVLWIYYFISALTIYSKCDTQTGVGAK